MDTLEFNYSKNSLLLRKIVFIFVLVGFALLFFLNLAFLVVIFDFIYLACLFVFFLLFSYIIYETWKKWANCYNIKIESDCLIFKKNNGLKKINFSDISSIQITRGSITGLSPFTMCDLNIITKNGKNFLFDASIFGSDQSELLILGIVRRLDKNIKVKYTFLTFPLII